MKSILFVTEEVIVNLLVANRLKQFSDDTKEVDSDIVTKMNTLEKRGKQHFPQT